MGCMQSTPDQVEILNPPLPETRRNGKKGEGAGGVGSLQRSKSGERDAERNYFTELDQRDKLSAAKGESEVLHLSDPKKVDTEKDEVAPIGMVEAESATEVVENPELEGTETKETTCTDDQSPTIVKSLENDIPESASETAEKGTVSQAEPSDTTEEKLEIDDADRQPEYYCTEVLLETAVPEINIDGPQPVKDVVGKEEKIDNAAAEVQTEGASETPLDEEVVEEKVQNQSRDIVVDPAQEPVKDVNKTTDEVGVTVMLPGAVEPCQREFVEVGNDLQPQSQIYEPSLEIDDESDWAVVQETMTEKVPEKKPVDENAANDNGNKVYFEGMEADPIKEEMTTETDNVLEVAMLPAKTLGEGPEDPTSEQGGTSVVESITELLPSGEPTTDKEEANVDVSETNQPDGAKPDNDVDGEIGGDTIINMPLARNRGNESMDDESIQSLDGSFTETSKAVTESLNESLGFSESELPPELQETNDEPILELKNVTAMTRIMIPEDKLSGAPAKSWGWTGFNIGNIANTSIGSPSKGPTKLVGKGLAGKILEGIGGNGVDPPASKVISKAPSLELKKPKAVPFASPTKAPSSPAKASNHLSDIEKARLFAASVLVEANKHERASNSACPTKTTQQGSPVWQLFSRVGGEEGDSE